MNRLFYLLSAFVITILVMTTSVHAENATIQLNTGWNLISIPVSPGSTSISSVLSGAMSKIEAVYAYNGTSYEAFVPGESSNTLTTIESGRGYWVYLNDSATLNVEGSTAPRSISIREGWNLVGYNSTMALSASEALQSINGKYLAIYAYDSSSNEYRAHIPGESSDLTQMEPGNGYWVYATESATWTLPGGENLPTPQPGARQVGQWDRFEETITNSKNYGDQYNGVSLDVTYTKPDGSTVKFWGFYDGGSNWKIRFMPDKLGAWKYEARFSDGSPGKSGTFTVVPSNLPGMIHKDETNPIWFGFKGGKHVLIRSLHMGPIFKAGFDGRRKALLDWAQQQGYNMFSSSTFFSDKSGGPTLWPLNAQEWSRVEKILNELSERKIMVYGFSGWFGDGRPYPKNAEGERQYLRYGLARFGPYWNLLWNVGGPEPNLHGYLKPADVNRIGSALKSMDVFDHLRSVHNRHGDYPYKTADWSSYATLQGSDSENKDLKVQRAYLLKQHTGDKPVYGQEDLWPGNTKQPACCFDGNTVRRWVWTHMVSAVALNYADNKGSGGSGFTGSGNLSDKVQEKHDWIKPVWDYFEKIPFYRMTPNDSVVNNGFCLAEVGRQYMVYLPFGGAVNVNVTNGPYNVEWINAHNPSEKRNGGTTSNGQNLTPPGADWVLYLTK
jgi:hypothetical protein